MKTIKELSDTLKISKVSLYKFLKRDEIKGHVFKKDSITVIDETGEELIKAYYSWEQDTDVNDTINETINNDSQIKNADIITLLQEQLKEKDNQINALLTIVANSQKIQATQLLTNNKPDITHTEKEKKLKFWHSLFPKKYNLNT